MLTLWSAALALHIPNARAATPAPDVYAFGDASFYGSTGAFQLTKPVVGMAPTPSGHGYWLVASDGGIFSFGDARFFGSTGALRLNHPIVGMAASPTGGGYWFVASDGGIFSFGAARFYGSVAAIAHGRTITAIGANASGNGYWLAATDGTVFSFGDSGVLKPLADTVFPASERVIGLASDPAATGYWLTSTPVSVPEPKIEAAIAWYSSRLGEAVYTGQCELAVENAYGTSSAYPTAFADWDAQPVKHPDWQNAPRGALVFYDTSAAGHVAISRGDGTVVSTSVNGRIGIVPTGYFQNPLGWAESPFL